MSKTEKAYVLDKIEILMAIEILEYHNKRYLSGDDKTRNEFKRDLLSECLSVLGSTAKGV